MNKKPLISSKDRKYYILAFKIMGDFGLTIAIPVVILSKIGQYFDAKYDFSPLFTIIGFILAAILTAMIIKKKTYKYAKEYENIEKEK